jgi:hypothetical protein
MAATSSAREHLLYRLPGNAELPRDVRLGAPVIDELLDHVTALAREPLRLPGVLERLGPDLPQPVECLLVICRVWCHAPIMTTPCCRCQQGVVKSASAAVPRPRGRPRRRRRFHDALRLACAPPPRVCVPSRSSRTL